MSADGVLTIHTDGAARGNPGPAAFAYVIRREGAPPIEEAGCLGRMTNNQAEYTALVRALEHAARLGTHHHLVIHSDSELMVKQLNGEYRVKDDTLRELYNEARRLRALFPSVTIRHVRRALNRDADRLCNEVLDSSRGKPAAVPPPSRKAFRGDERDPVRAAAVECLRQAAGAWAAGGPGALSPEQVWDQLWSILEEHHVLRRPRSG